MDIIFMGIYCCAKLAVLAAQDKGLPRDDNNLKLLFGFRNNKKIILSCGAKQGTPWRAWQTGRSTSRLHLDQNTFSSMDVLATTALAYDRLKIRCRVQLTRNRNDPNAPLGVFDPPGCADARLTYPTLRRLASGARFSRG
jgi:hypothetical protein